MTSNAARRPIHLALDGIVGDAEHRHSVFDQRDRDRELGNAVDELLGAVERIDDPHAPAFQAVVVVGGLFREPSVSGKRIAQQFLIALIGLEVGLP